MRPPPQPVTLLDHDWRVLQAPVAPCEDFPHGIPGAVHLKGAVYLLHVLSDCNFTIVGVRFDGLTLSKAKDWTAKFYHVSAESGECSCPHSTYRQAACKHYLLAVKMGLIPADAGQHPNRQLAACQTRQPVSSLPEIETPF